jgi:carboxylate-amine ligase
MNALDGYRSPTYDDAVDGDGRLRPEGRAVLEAVLAHDLPALGRAVRDAIDGRGIRFAAVNGDDSWHVDPIPRVIGRADWAQLEAGLAQRARALNAFVADVYGARRIVAEGVVPQRVLDTAEHLEPALAGFQPPDGVWTGIAGLDVVRDSDGKWLVLEDNVRTPSGIGYWHAARRAVLEHLDLPGDACPRPLDGAITTALRATFGPGHVVVLTDGPDNSAYWEHRWIAETLEIPLVEPGDLIVRDARLFHDGKPVDGVYRRTDADSLDSEVGRLLQPVLVAGGVKLVNCFGTGVADDKLAHAYVPDMIRFYLGEEPALDQVETFDLGEEKNLERALDIFDQLVIKDRGSYGGIGVAVNPHAEAADVEALREKVRAAPEEYIAQRLVGLSTHPTVIDGGLAPRHVDLRPYVLMAAPDDVRVLPGGVTRVALDEGALVVNSSQNGGAKDTWVQV